MRISDWSSVVCSSDLLASAHGRVKLHERATIPAECGKPLSAITTGLGVRIYRNGQPVGFWEEGAHVLQAGDNIVEILESVESESSYPSKTGDNRLHHPYFAPMVTTLHSSPQVGMVSLGCPKALVDNERILTKFNMQSTLLKSSHLTAYRSPC